jgi:hypothetical protein
MERHFRCVSLAAVLGLSCLFTLPAHAAAVIATQQPCSSSICLSFANTGTIPVIRTFKFTAPTAGTAQVSFQGSLVCSDVNTSQSAPVVVDLASQIVTASNAVPSPSAPGGLRHAVVWEPLIVGVAFTGFTNSFNLASSRVISIAAAGPRTYYFKIGRLRMDPDTSCVVYGATFSVVFVP